MVANPNFGEEEAIGDPGFPRLLESPGKSWILFLEKSRTWKVLEIEAQGPGKSWKNILENCIFSIASNGYLISTFNNTLLHAVNSFCAGPYFEQCEYMFFPIFPYM